ncbi:MAG: CAAX prenyl protease-related protein [Pseudomonadota bacterium]
MARAIDIRPGGVVPFQWLGAGVLFELGVLYLASHEQYVPLTRAANAHVLSALHVFSQIAAVGLVGALALAGWRMLCEEAAPIPALRRGRPIVLACHLGAFLMLLGLYQVLPSWREIGLELGPREITVFALMVAAFLIFTGTACALALPASFCQYWTRAGNVVTLLALMGLSTFLFQSQWLTIEVVRRPIEDATLGMSLALYSLIGLPAAEVVQWGPDPILMAETFAIRIAPVCSGYQGLLACMTLIGGYMLLEREGLRLRRALLMAALALGVLFLLNAARIALLFAIGVAGRPDVALNGFHSHFGVLSLLVVVGLFMLALEAAPFRRIRVAGRHLDGYHREENPQYETLGLLLLPLAGLLSAGLLTGLVRGSIEWLYPVPILIGAGLAWRYRAAVSARMSPGPSPWGFVCGVGVFALWVALVPPNDTQSAQTHAALAAIPAPLALIWIVQRVLGGSLVVPLVEELAFRGGAMEIARNTLPAEWSGPARIGLALTGSSVAFGLLHAEMVAGVLAGLAYGGLAFWRGSLSDAILAHGVTNALLALTVLSFGHWSYW